MLIGRTSAIIAFIAVDVKLIFCTIADLASSSKNTVLIFHNLIFDKKKL
jgi:hypothetical protein